jgi:carnitine monooxygenase subunit
MQRDQQVAVVERLLDLVEHRTTDLADAPYERTASAYDDPSRFACERELFFRRTPLWSGFSGELPEPGDFLTTADSGVPIVVVRQDDGTLAAFLNVCRHRGTQVVCQSAGHADELHCPYHGWSYGRDGHLARVPFGRGFPGMDRVQRSLVRVPVAERWGLVFTCATPGLEIDLEEHLGPLGPELASWGVGNVRRLHERTIESPINWKLALDVFAEGYHFDVLHSRTIAHMTHDNVMTYDRLGRHYRLAFPARTIESLRRQPVESWEPLNHLSFVYYLYPNISLNVTGAKVPTVRVFRIVPGPDVAFSTTRHTLFSRKMPEDPVESKLLFDHFDSMHDVVEREDHSVAIRAQAALAARAQTTLIFGRNEPSLIHMHEQYDDMLARATETGAR